MTNKQIAKELNEIMGKRNKVEIYCNGYNNLVIRGSKRGVIQSVKELVYCGLKQLSFQEPDKDNPYCDGSYMAIVGKVAA